jgi:CRISPR-associated protein Csx17
MNEIALPGCTPTPLASYLKALAVLRLVAEQAGDPDATGCWHNDEFVLRTRLSREQLLQFFLERYCPTPIISPWSGRAGFLEGEDSEDSERKGAVAVRGIRASQGKRFSKYRDVFGLLTELPEIQRLNQARAEVKRLEKDKKQGKPVDDEQIKRLKSEQEAAKATLIPMLRARLPEACLGWIDTCFAVGSKAEPAPLFGTGGNEGSMDYSVNHVLNLMTLIDIDTDRPIDQADDSLKEALFSDSVATTRDANLGFLSPSSTGGANMSSGFDGPTAENPWNAVLAMEGALFLAATAVRRHESSADAVASAPFFFGSIRGGHGAAVTEEKTRPEFWAPLWDRHVTLFELGAVFGEGRVVIGRRAARDALDAARAIASFGVDRGICQFQRYAFAERRGKGYSVAAPLQRIRASRNRAVDLLADLDDMGWLRQVHEAPSLSLKALAIQLDSALFVMTQRSDRQTVERVLRLLGRIETAAALSEKLRGQIRPVPVLSQQWTVGASDHSAEFRIATALANLSLDARGDGRSVVLGLRPHLVPMTLDERNWNPASRFVCWGASTLERNFAQLLHRRRLEAIRLGVEGELLASRAGATLEDVSRFLEGGTDDRRIAELAHGLACIERLELDPPKSDTPIALPPAYALLKPFFTAESTLRALNWLPRDRSLRLSDEIPARLAADEVEAALHLAWQRLRALGIELPGRASPCYPRRGDGPRLLAALVIPLSFGETRRLLNRLELKPETESTEETLNTSA